MSKSTARTVLSLTGSFFAVFFVWPVLQILRGGFVDADGKLTFSYLAVLLTDPIYLGALRNSFLLACAGTSIALLIAVPLAALSDRFIFPLKGFLNSAVLIPMILPPFVGAIGIKQIFGQYGAVNALLIDLGLRPRGWAFDWFAANQFWGVAIVEALSLYPIVYLNAVAALANIDPSMTQAAANLGAKRWTVFRKITLPLIRPVMIPAITLGIVWTFNNLNIVWLISNAGEPSDQTHILVSFVYKAAFNLYRYGYAAALSMVIFFILLMFSLVFMKKTKATEAAY